MKKLHLLTFLLAVFLCSCSKYDIKTAETVVNLHAGDSYQLDVACDKLIRFESSKACVATVSRDGLVEALRVGTTEIRIYNLKYESIVKVNVLRVDGQYHPMKKISKIYKVDDFSGEKYLSEEWIWEYDNLVKIACGYPSYFYYDEQGRVTSIDASTNFTYGENGLEKIEYYLGNWLAGQVFYHCDHGLVSEIILNCNGIETFPEDGYWSTNKLTWKDGNVVRVDTQEKVGDNEKSFSATFTYDDKANPFCGFPWRVYTNMELMDFPLLLSANNLLTATYEGTDGQGNSSAFEIMRCAYTYDGDYPIYACDTYGNQYYYEYE